MNSKNQLWLEYQRQGYVVIPDFIDRATIDALETECSRLVELNPSHSGSSNVYEAVGPRALEATPAARSDSVTYDAIRTAWPLTKDVRDVLFGEGMRNLVQELLRTSTPVLFNEQYLVKQSMSGSKGAFGWHRDSDSLLEAIGRNDIPYLSVWIAIDDMTEANGCLRVRSFRAGNGAMGVDGADGSGEEIAIEVAAGTAVVMSSMLEHMSGPNMTRFSRRAWMPQFSECPILHPGTNLPVGLSIPL